MKSTHFAIIPTFTDTVKAMPRISTKHQVTVPVTTLEEAGLRAGDQVVIEALGEGEVRIRRGALTFESAFGALTGAYPSGYLEQLDAQDQQR
jgi:bifunctional DNA-binding transcriptional regulator/antitoxin component of YhaV-PrlF toxin-antitoxin module